jgi:hypothetical protein
MLLPWFHPHNVYVVCAHFAWWCVSKATSCELWRDCYNSQGADFGASQVVSEPRFFRYPRVRSACRITLPMVVVLSRVKTILLKMRWIDLSRSAFYSLPLCFSPLTFAVLSRLSYLPLWVLGSYMGGRSLAFNLIGPLFGSSSSSTWARIHCWWCRVGTSCWWCRQVQHGAWRSDSLTNSSSYTSMDLGARSLVGGVDCNGPENPPFRFVCCFIFVHHHALSPCMFLSMPKLAEIKSFIFILLIWFYNRPSLHFSYFKLKLKLQYLHIFVNCFEIKKSSFWNLWNLFWNLF